MGHRGNGFTGGISTVGRAVLRGPQAIFATLFRRREIVIRSGGRVRYLSLPGAVQIVLVLGLAAASGWVGYTTRVWFDVAAIVEERDREIARTEGENRALHGAIARMKSEFSDVAGTLERNHAELDKLVAQNGALRGELGQLRLELSAAESDRSAGEKRQLALRRQIDALESKLAGAEKRSVALAGALDATRSALAAAKREKSDVATVRDTLKTRVAGLERRLLALRDSQNTLVGRATEKTQQDIDRIERIILRAGLDPRDLLARGEGAGEEATAAGGEGRTGQGGPFIPAAEAAARTAAGAPAGSAERERFVVALKSYDRHLIRWEELQKVLRSLPLVAPLDHYRLSSGHGKRRDPINRKMAIHEGVDLVAERRTAVHATAPGKVVSAGWHGRFGRMIEIDHGYGIRTRYAHLHRILVRRGAEVTFGQKIGQVGSTGRSTGTHLHYEVLVDGKSVDPQRLMKAGKDVFKG